MDLLKYVVGGLIGAVIGAVIWAAIAHFANFELGWIAWGVGALAGLGVRIAADNEATDMGGIIAVLCAIIGLSAGKYAAVYMDVDEFTSEMVSEVDLEHAARVAIADEIVDSWSAQGHTIEWPDGTVPEEAWEPSDYPADVWTAMETMWDGMGDTERKSRMDELDFGSSDLTMNLTNEVFTDTFTPWDFLWFGLALASAWSIAARDGVG